VFTIDPFEAEGWAQLFDETAAVLLRAAAGTASGDELALYATAQRRLAAAVRARSDRAVAFEVEGVDRFPFDQDAAPNPDDGKEGES
jgi:hypothetical protein